MKFRIVGIPGQITRLEKFVVTSFLDVKNPGRVTSYVEVCSNQGGTFSLIIPENADIAVHENLYKDENACARLMNQYSSDGQGQYSQEIGGNILNVVPNRCIIQSVAPPQHHNGSFSWNIDFGEYPVQEKCWGTWICWEQSSGFAIKGSTLTHGRIECCVDDITVENFHFFIVQPLGYRSDNSSYEVSLGTTALVAQETIKDLVLESEVSPDFPVFPVWKDIFHGRKFLKNRKPINLTNGQQLVITFTSLSEKRLTRTASLSYFLGIGIALSVECFVNGIYALFDTYQRVVVIPLTILGFVFSLVFGFYGLKILRKQ